MTSLFQIRRSTKIHFDRRKVVSTATLEQPHKTSHPRHETPPQPSPTEQMIGVLAGFWVARCVYVAAKLGVADLLASGPKTVEQLAMETGSHAPSLYRLLRGLAGHGIFREESHHLFVNTPT